jgi:hypothetical protein
MISYLFLLFFILKNRMFGTITSLLSLVLLASAELIFNGVLPYPSATVAPSLLMAGAQSSILYGTSASGISSGPSIYPSANSYIGSSQANSVILKGSLPSPQPAQSVVYYPTMTSKTNFYSSKPLSTSISSTTNTIIQPPVQFSNTFVSSRPQVSYMIAAPTAQPSYNSMTLGSNILNNGLNSISSAFSTPSSYTKDTYTPTLTSSSSVLSKSDDSRISYDFSSSNVST